MLDFQQSHPELSLASQQSDGDKQIVSKVDTRRLDQLRDELTAAEIKVIDFKSTYTAIKESNSDNVAAEVLAGSVQSVDQQTLERERQQLLGALGELEARLQKHRRVSTEDHPVRDRDRIRR